MKQGISEIVGTAEGADGSRVTVYRALRRLLCAPCGAPIGEGSLFTRRRLEGQQLRTLPLCRKCAPFALSIDGDAFLNEDDKPAPEGDARRERSPLLDALLAPMENKEAPAASDSAAAREGVLKRLAPALRVARRRGS